MKILLAILEIFIYANVYSTTYYVSNAGNDGADGLTFNTSWATLAKVRGVNFNAGDSILFKRGDTFYGYLTLGRAGSSGNPIIFSAYGTGVNPAITGFTTITDWTNKGGNIWESTNAISTLAHCNMVSINGVNTPMARYPRADASNGGYLTIATTNGTSFLTCYALTGTPNYTSCEMVIKTSAYNIKRIVATSQSGNTINFSSSSIPAGYGFFFQNSLSLLTSQNDWYYNASTGKLSIYSTSQPLNVKIATIEQLINTNARYMKFENITFTGANTVVFNSYFYDLTINNCAFSYIGGTACYLAGSGAYTVTNCTFSDVNQNAITVNGTGVNVSNNTISNILKYPGMSLRGVHWTTVIPFTQSTVSGAINATSNTATISNNVINNVGYNGISFYGNNVTVDKNFIDTFCTIASDGGGIYTYTGTGTPMTGINITNNVCVNGIGNNFGSGETMQAAGIYLDERSANANVIGNSILNCYRFGILLNVPGDNIIVRNNTICGSDRFQFYLNFYGPYNFPTGLKLNKNIFVSTKTGQTEAGQTKTDFQKSVGFGLSNDIVHNTLNPGVITSIYTSIDSNYYCRPTLAGDGKVINISSLTMGDPIKNTLSEWQTLTGFDKHSYGSPQNVSAVDQIHFVINETGSTRKFKLTTPLKNMAGATLSGDLSLQPYKSVILFGSGEILYYKTQ